MTRIRTLYRKGNRCTTYATVISRRDADGRALARACTLVKAIQIAAAKQQPSSAAVLLSALCRELPITVCYGIRWNSEYDVHPVELREIATRRNVRNARKVA